MAAALAGEPVGTLFPPTGKRRSRKLMWLAYASVSQGELVLDAGAVRAVAERKASLLPAGIIGGRGRFRRRRPGATGRARSGQVVARGLVNYDSAELPGMIGRSTHELVAERGAEFDREVVHRDDLIVRPTEAEAMTPVEIVGWGAALVGTVLGLPQVYRLARTRNVEGLSLPAWQAILALNIAWTSHGVILGQPNMIVPNVLGLGSTLPILILMSRELGRPLAGCCCRRAGRAVA